MRSMRGITVMAAAASIGLIGGETISLAQERWPEGPPPEGSRSSGRVRPGKLYGSNGKREMERRRRQLERNAPAPSEPQETER